MNIDNTYLLNCLTDILSTPSPSGYTKDVIEKVKTYVQAFGLECELTNKGCLVVDIPSENSEYTTCLSAHVDTLGLMVRSITESGDLRVVEIGGNQFTSLDSEYCTIHTRSGKNYTGTVVSTSPASHVYEDNRTLVRSADNTVIRIDELTKSADDTKALGINNGDFVSLDPKTTITESNFIKSRYLDDKASVACVLTVLKYMSDNKITPKNNLKLFFSVYEEVGHGAAYIPGEIDEVIAIDMGCIGKDLACTESDVSICAKDRSGPYDYELTNKLIDLAVANELSYVVDIYPFYSSDGSAALYGGNDIKSALIGPGIHASHGMERTHLNSLINTTKLIINYIS